MLLSVYGRYREAGCPNDSRVSELDPIAAAIDGPPPRVLSFVASFPPYFSGTGAVALNNAIQLRDGGFQVRIVTPSLDEPLHTEIEGIPVIRRQLAFRLGLAGLFKRLDDLGDFDILHLHAPFVGGGDQAVDLAVGSAKPMIVTYQQDLLGRGLKGLAFAVYTKLRLRALLSVSSAIIVPSMDYARESVLSQELLSSRRLVEIPNGVDTKHFTPGTPKRKLPLTITPEEQKRTFLFVGALDRPHYFKGVDILLRAAKIIETTGVRIVIVGDGDMRSSYELLAKKLGITNRVFFAGRVSPELLPDYYRSTICTVLPSINMGEVFGITLLEAMASGKPTIATTLPGVRTVVDNGLTGLLVPPSDVESLAEAMITILSPRLAEEMGREGRLKAVAKYDWAKIGFLLRSLCRGVLSRDASMSSA